MRGIIFRGKRIDTEEWVTGHFVRLYDDKGHHSHRIYPGYAETDCGDFYPDWYEVDPETVSQFTGRLDKSGKRVFEGDILDLLDGEFRGVVLWSNHDQCFILSPNGDETLHLCDFGNYGREDYYEVVGNNYDNPELIGGKADG